MTTTSKMDSDQHFDNVDLAGQLSNPEWELRIRRFARVLDSCTDAQVTMPLARVHQRRLNEVELKELASLYRAGARIRELCTIFGIHRTTALAALERMGVSRRAHEVKLTGTRLDRAVELYADGLSLADVGSELRVDAATVRRALAGAGIASRPRRGWPCQQTSDG